MKYSIMKDYEDLSYWLVDRDYVRATESKIHESDSIHECFTWFSAESFRNEDFTHLNVELEHETVYCVYWSDFDEQYYVCKDKGDSTLDDVCFRGLKKNVMNFIRNILLLNRRSKLLLVSYYLR